MCRCPAAVPFMSWSRKSEKLVLRGEEPSITSADLHLIQEGKYTRTWQEGSGNPHKKCMRCGFETDEDYNYCPKCGGRI